MVQQVIRKLTFILLCVLATMANVTWAQSEDTGKAEIATYCKAVGAGGDCIRKECIKDGRSLCIEQYRFTPYQPNSVVYQTTEHDDNSAEVNYSLRYLLSPPDCTGDRQEDCLNNYSRRWEHFVTYTGKFDFYVGTRPSGPVINRLNNPAWHSRKYLGDNDFHLKWLDIGIEHKSNGQVVSANELIPSTTVNKAASEYLAGNHRYIDSISRSMNYLSLETKTNFNLGQCDPCNVWLKLFTMHRGEESDVYWGKYAGQNIKFADFERLRAIINIPLNHASKFDEKGELGIEWTVGDKGIATDSVNVWLRYPMSFFGYVQLPVAIRVHAGPMNELSNYSESQRSIGVGLAFFH